MVTQMWKLFALIVVFLLTQGCATLKNGTRQKVFIDSLPSQATFHMIALHPMDWTDVLE